MTGVATTAAARVRPGAIAHAKGAAMKIAPADLAATAEADAKAYAGVITMLGKIRLAERE